MARIERALARVEAVASAPAPVPAAADNGELEALRQAYGSLRDKVEGAVGELDRLIGGAG